MFFAPVSQVFERLVLCSGRYKAVYNYKPQNRDELELKEGDIVQVMEKCDDGWFVGKELSEPSPPLEGMSLLSTGH